MDNRLFDKFRTIAYEKAGISLNDKKKELVTARVAKRLRALNIDNPAHYLEYLTSEPSGDELVQFLDAISTNFTHFMREKEHFSILTQEAKRWMGESRQRIRLWCAASSSGEEPYSIAVTLSDAFEDRDMDFRILATDISTRVLEQAINGVYLKRSLNELSKLQRTKYFIRLGDRQDENCAFQVKDAIRERLTFKRLNLSKPPFPMTGPLDAVFCRNVMIYFDRHVRQGLIREIERLLAPGALLMIGHSETLTGLDTGLKMVSPSVYKKMSA